MPMTNNTFIHIKDQEQGIDMCLNLNAISCVRLLDGRTYVHLAQHATNPLVLQGKAADVLYREFVKLSVSMYSLSRQGDNQ